MDNILLQQAFNFIAGWEGCKLKAYLCPAGVPTIGYGNTEYLKQFANPLSQTITQQKADELLQDEILHNYTILIDICEPKLNYNQIVALLSLMFNIGVNAFTQSTLLKKLNQNSNQQIITQEFLRWVYIKKVFSEGLQNRRKSKVKLFYNASVVKTLMSFAV